MATIGPAQALKEQLNELQAKKSAAEGELTKLKADATLLDLEAKMNRVRRDIYGCRSSREASSIWTIERKRVHDACKDDTNCQERPWQSADGQIWCGSDSTQQFNRAETQLNTWNKNKEDLSNKIKDYDKQIKDVNEKLLKYADTAAGKQEVETLGKIEQTKAKTQQLVVEAQAETQRQLAKTESTKKRLLWITIGVVALLGIILLIWWIRQRRAAKK